jgi:hypothetical protein
MCKILKELGEFTEKKAKAVLMVSIILLIFVIMLSKDAVVRWLTFYVWLHLLLGPLDWYLIYKLYKKLKEVVK